MHIRVQNLFVGRTSLVIDDNLVNDAMRRYGLHSKRSVVDLALRRLVGDSMTREDVLAMEGARWEGDLDEMRSDRPPARLPSSTRRRGLSSFGATA